MGGSFRAMESEGAAVVGDPRLPPPDVPSRGLFDAIVRHRAISREYPNLPGIDGIGRIDGLARD